jgi:hypothetical protein
MNRIIASLCVVLLFMSRALAADEKKTAPAPATQPAHADTPAWRAFERFKALAGQRWEGKSTKGWTEQLTYSLIAGDSVVMEQSAMAHDTAMVTMYSMDGDELMLTHYCAAKNVPRMKATQISDDGSEVLFTFVDGLNLKDGRDTPHMDKANFKFAGDGTMHEQWTFYSNGKEQWMEEIRYARLPGESSDAK